MTCRLARARAHWESDQLVIKFYHFLLFFFRSLKICTIIKHAGVIRGVDQLRWCGQRGIGCSLLLASANRPPERHGNYTVVRTQPDDRCIAMGQIESFTCTFTVFTVASNGKARRQVARSWGCFFLFISSGFSFPSRASLEGVQFLRCARRKVKLNARVGGKSSVFW